MSQTNTDIAQSVPKIKTFPDDQPIIDTFYCEKCYDMIIYFIDECDFLSRKSTKFERSSKIFEKSYTDYRLRLDDLQFIYDELKADKEALDEEFQLLQQKALTSEMSHVTKTTTVNDTKKTSKIILSLDDMKVDDAENVDSKNSKSISLDLDSFDKYFLNSHITLNRSHLQLMFDYLAKMIINRQKNSKIVLVNQTDTKSIRYDSDFDMRKDELLDADEHLRTELKKSRDLNQNLELKIKNLTESNRILTETNFNLVEETTKLGCSLNDKIETELKQVKEELRHEKEQSVKIVSENENFKNEIQQIYETLEIQNHLIKNSENTGKLLADKDKDIVQLRTRLDQISKEHDDYIFLTDEKIKKLKLEVCEKSENCFKIEQEMAQLKEQYQMLVSDSQYELSTITEEYRKNLFEAEQRTQETGANKNFELERENLVKQIEELKSKLEESEAQKVSQKNEFEKSMDEKCQEISAEHEDLVKKLNTQMEELRSKIENSQDECTHYKAELESALNKIINLSTNNTELHNVVSEEEEMMIQDRKTMENMNLEVAELKKCLELANNEIKKMNDDRNRKASEECMDVDMETDEPLILLNETNPDLGLLKQQITEKESEITRLRSELSNMEQSNQILNSEFGRMRQFFESELAESRSKHVQEVELLNNKINEISNVNSSLENELKNDKNNMETNRQKLMDLESKLAENEDQIENFKLKISSLETDKLMVESTKDQESQNCAKLQSEIDILKIELDHVKADNEKRFVQKEELIQDLETKIAENEDQIENFKLKISSLETDKLMVESTKDQESQNCAKLQSEIDILKIELDHVKADNEKRFVQKEELIQDLETKIAENEDQIENFKLKISNFETDKLMVESTKDQESQNCAKLQSEIDILKIELDHVKADNEKKFVQKEELIQDLETKIAENEDQIENFKLKISSLETDKLMVESTKDQESQNCAKLQSEIDILKIELDHVKADTEKKFVQKEELIQDLETKLEQSKQIIQSLNGKIKDLEIQKGELESNSENLRKNHDLDQDNSRIFQEQIQNLKLKYDQYVSENEAKISCLENQSTELIRSLEMLKSENADKQLSLESSSEELRVLREKIDLLSHEHDFVKQQKENEILDMNNKLAEWNQRYEQAISDWHQKEKLASAEIEQIKEENKNKTNELDCLSQRYKTLTSESESNILCYQQKLEKYSTQIEVLTVELNNFKNKLDERESILENLKVELDAALVRKSELESKVVEMEEANNRIAHEKNSLKTVKSDLEQAHLRLENENMELRKDIYRLRSDLQNLRETQDFGVTNSEILSSENEDLITKLDETRQKLELQTNESNNRIKDFENQVQILNSKLEEVNREHEIHINQTKCQMEQYENVKQNLEKNLAENLEKIKDLESQLAELDQRQTNYSQQIELEITNLRNENHKLDTALKENSNMHENFVRDSEQIILELGQKYECLNRDNKEKMEQMTAEFEIARSKSKSDIDNLQSKVNQYEAQKTELECLIQKLNEAHEDKIVQLECKIKDYEKENDSIKFEHETKFCQEKTIFDQTVKQYDEKIDQLEQKICEYQQIKSNLESNLEHFEKEEVLSKQKIDQLQSQLESLSQNHQIHCQETKTVISNLESHIAQLNQSIEAINGEKKCLKSQIESLDKQINSDAVKYQACVDEIQTKLNDSKKAYDCLMSESEQKITSMNQVIKEFESNKQLMDSNFEKLNEQMESMCQKHSEYVTEMETKMRDTKSQLEESRQLKINADNEKESISETLNQEICQLKHQIGQLETELKNIRINADNEKESISETLNQEICQLKHQVGQLETELKNIRINADNEKESISETLNQEICQLKHQVGQLETELKNIRINADNEKESISETLNQEICQLKHQVGQLETELKNIRINANNLNQETVKQLKEQTEKSKEIEADYKSKVELLEKLNAEMLVKNEQLENDVKKSKSELESKIDEVAQLEIRIEVLYQQLEELDQNINQARQENANLKEMTKNLNLECERTAKERDLFIKTANENMEDINRRNKQKLDESQQAIHGLQAEIETLNAQIRDYDSIKSLEMAQLSKKFESREMRLGSERDELRKKCSENEEKIKNLSIDISILENEKSELRSQLIDYENQIDGLSQDFGLRFEREIESLRQRSLEFELKYNDQLSQNKELATKYENAYESLVSNELKFKEKLFNLNTDLEKSLKKLAESKEMLDKRDTQYADMVKLKEASANEVHDLQRQICEVLKEKGEMANSLIELTRQLSELKQQRNQEPSGSSNPKDEEEISSLKSQVAKYSKERRTYKEEHSQNKKLKSQIEKQTKEIAKLEETIKEMQETNDFLTRQINNLNDHIYEMSNKENENDSSENGATPLSRKSLGRKSLGNKRLLEIQNESMAMGGTAHESNKTKDFTGDNINQSDQDANDMAEMTPSSARRLNQCAQQ